MDLSTGIRIYEATKQAVGMSIDWCIPQIPYLRKSRERRIEGTDERVSWWKTVKRFPNSSALHLCPSIINATWLGGCTYGALDAAVSGSPGYTTLYLLLGVVINKGLGGMILDGGDDLEDLTKELENCKIKQPLESLIYVP